RLVNSQRIVSVHLNPTDSVGDRFLCDGFRIGLLMQRDADGVLVVLAEEDGVRLIDAGKVEPFVEISFRCSAVTEEGDRYILLFAQAEGPASASRMRNMTGDNNLRRIH